MKRRRVMITLEVVTAVPLDRLRSSPNLELLVLDQNLVGEKVDGKPVPLVDIQQVTAQNVER